MYVFNCCPFLGGTYLNTKYFYIYLKFITYLTFIHFKVTTLYLIYFVMIVYLDLLLAFLFGCLLSMMDIRDINFMEGLRRMG